MAYNKKTWISDEIITKDALNNIENGIEAVEKSIPKNISQLVNDSKFIKEQDLNDYVAKDDLNDYVTKDELSDYASGDSVKHVFITEAEFNKLSKEEQDSEDTLYIITDSEMAAIDLSNCATKDDLHDHSNLNVLNQISSTKIQTWDNALQQNDLNSYAKKSELNNYATVQKVEELEQNIMNDSAEIHFLHPAANKAGDCSVIKTCEGKWIMIDTGEDGGFAYTKQQLDTLGCTELEMLFITHPHSDHIGEATNIINTYRPKKIYYKNFDWGRLPDYELIDWKTQQYHDMMIQAGIAVGAELIEATDTVVPISPCENIKIFASTFYNYENLNNCSMLFLYNFRNVKCLFSGDATYETEKHVKGQIGAVDIMKIAHHGAATGTGLEFLAEVQPKVCLTGGIKGLDNDGGSQASLVAKRCKFYLGKVYDMWEVNYGGSIKIFNGAYVHNLIESKLHSSWYRTEEGHAHQGEYVYFKDNGDLASNEFISDKLNMYYINDWYMATGWFKVDDIDYYAEVNTGEIYRNQWLKHTDGNWYYLKLNGAMAKNESLNINGKFYQFDQNGVCTNPDA